MKRSAAQMVKPTPRVEPVMTTVLPSMFMMFSERDDAVIFDLN
jgi:hypothetical protein